jgi:rsbT co-antagonist protein RsbR
VLPVTHDTIVMPLVGALDTERLHQLQERALKAIEQMRARRLILDITGVPVFDTAVAQGVVQVVQAGQLLGASVALVGVRPEVAQTIVGLGLHLERIATFATLQEAIAAGGRRNVLYQKAA